MAIIELFTIGALLFTGAGLGIHTIDEGHLGVYYRGGKLLKTVTEPGFQYKVPMLTKHENVQVTWQTDRLPAVLCGSSRGGTATLSIEVVNRLKGSHECVERTISQFGSGYDQPLIFDHIPSEVAQFCKNYPLEDIYIRRFDELDEVLMEKLTKVIATFGMSDCLQIQQVRIGRPKLSESMSKRFEAIEHEEKEKDLAETQKETEKVKLETQLQKAKMLSQQLQEEARIQLETKVISAKKAAEIKLIESEMKLKEAESLAKGALIKQQSEAAGLAAVISAFDNNTEHMLEWHRTAAYWNSSNKVYYFADSADHMPKTFVGGEAGVLGAR